MFYPLYDVIIIERKVPETMIGSLIIPASAQEMQDQGTIISVGEGKLCDDGTIRPLRVKVGDHILYSQYANLEFEYNGKKYTSMREADVIAVLNRNPMEDKDAA